MVNRHRGGAADLLTHGGAAAPLARRAARSLLVTARQPEPARARVLDGVPVAPVLADHATVLERLRRRARDLRAFGRRPVPAAVASTHQHGGRRRLVAHDARVVDSRPVRGVRAVQEAVVGRRRRRRTEDAVAVGRLGRPRLVLRARAVGGPVQAEADVAAERDVVVVEVAAAQRVAVLGCPGNLYGRHAVVIVTW